MENQSNAYGTTKCCSQRVKAVIKARERSELSVRKE